MWGRVEGPTLTSLQLFHHFYVIKLAGSSSCLHDAIFQKYYIFLYSVDFSVKTQAACYSRDFLQNSYLYTCTILSKVDLNVGLAFQKLLWSSRLQVSAPGGKSSKLKLFPATNYSRMVLNNGFRMVSPMETGQWVTL